MWKVLFLSACVGCLSIVYCDEKCGPNERYVACPDTMCIPRNCSQRGYPVPCPILGPDGNCPGKPACICIENYLRDDYTGVCMPSKKCNSPTVTTQTTTEPDDNCNEQPPTCGKNEEYNNCTNTGSRPYLCSELGFPLNFDKKCKPGCMCKIGYARNVNGICIPFNDCPSCGGDKNATSGCGNNCGRTCATYNKKPVVCSLSCLFNGCNCRDGFVYDPYKKSCVRPKDCTPTCKANEQYSSCANGGCGPKYCSQLGDPWICVDPVTCTKGCICVDGYLKSSNGTCVPKDQCPPMCTGQNEYFVKCIRGCSNQSRVNIGKQFNCPNQPVGVCKSGCQCKPGFYRNDSNICVPQSECPPTCKANEEYSPCANGGCGPKNCSQLGDPRICVDPVTCTKGCICVDGYLKSSNGTCVPKDQCPPRCTGQHEYFVECIQSCSNQSCVNIGKKFNCPNQLVGVCKSGCQCKPRFWRNASNVCIPQSECPTPDCPDGEFWNWCPNVRCEGDFCAKTRNSPQSCPVGIVCDQPRCVCSYNRKRDRQTGKCILIRDCPKFQCGYNEKYEACPAGCVGDNCTDYINKTKCKPSKTVVTCRPQCKCIKGYYRNADGDCVPACECPTDSPELQA